ncbi:MAG: S8 family serine peptidase, partial [Oscillospiraceae bacterium]|nr:S8 family serine peptidase [Oscillospiraceae bacterium]
MKKRLLAFLLAAAIMLSDVAPVVTAFAEDVRQEPAVEQPLAPEQPETPADTPEVPRETEVPAEEAETPAETPRAEEETPAETPAPVEQPEDPAAETPATDTPAADQPAVEEPTDTPVAEEPADTPVTEEPADTPVTEEPADIPVVDEPVTEEPVVDETLTEEPVVDETLTEEPVTEETEPEEKSVFPGMPEGYKLTATQAKFKAELQTAETKAAYSDLKTGDYVPGRVMFMADSEEEALLVAEGYGAELISYAYGVAVIRLPEEATVQMALETAWADNNLPAVYPDLIYKSGPVDMKKPDGEMLGTQMAYYDLLRETDWFDWGYGADPLLSPEDVDYFWHLQEIGVYQAWGTTQGSDDITVAVIDSGLDSCPDLGANIVGISSGELGASFDIAVGESHGTHVTGIIGATYGNDRDGAGVAPETNVVSYCVMDADDDGTWNMSGSLIVAAINLAAENAEDCNIINMSLGRHGKDYMMEYAINNAVNKGIVVIAAAGNDGTNIKCYPAAYDNVISVAATDQSGNRAFFSNYG